MRVRAMVRTCSVIAHERCGNPTSSSGTWLGQRDSGATANLIPDALLGALAIEHGLEVATVDADFARFAGVRWTNPLA